MCFASQSKRITRAKDNTIFNCPCPAWRTSPYELYCSDVEIQLFTWRLVYFTSCHLIDLQVDRHSIRRLKLIHQVQLIHHQVQLSAFDLGKINRPSFDTSSIVFCRLIQHVETLLYLMEYNFCWEERMSVTGRSLSNFSNFTDRFVIHYVVKSENINNSPPRVRVKRAHLTWIGPSNSSIHIFLSNTDDKINRIMRHANPIFQYDLHHSDKQMSECRRKLFVLSWVEHENQIECQKTRFPISHWPTMFRNNYSDWRS